MLKSLVHHGARHNELPPPLRRTSVILPDTLVLQACRCRTLVTRNPQHRPATMAIASAVAGRCRTRGVAG